jgi:hypothetical protein
VAQAITAELKRTRIGVLLIRKPEATPSLTATTIAAGPPKSSITRKMKVSETVTLVFARGILTEKRELIATVIKASSRNRNPRLDQGMRMSAPTVTPPPRNITDQR